MPAAPAKRNREFNPEEFFGADETTLEEKRATELQKARAADRKRMEESTLGGLTKIPMPVEKEPELVEQEYGRPLETTAAEEGEEMPEEGEETPEEEGAAPEEETEMSQEQMAYQAERERKTEAAEKQMRMLQSRGLILNQQIKNANLTMERKLQPAEKLLKVSQFRDRTKNFIRVTRVLGAAGVSLWYTIIVPLLMILLIIGAAILWLCGFNLGPPSANTLQLKQKYNTQKKLLTRERDKQVQPIKQELQKISQQINQTRVNIIA